MTTNEMKSKLGIVGMLNTVHDGLGSGQQDGVEQDGTEPGLFGGMICFFVRSAGPVVRLVELIDAVRSRVGSSAAVPGRKVGQVAELPVHSCIKFDNPRLVIGLCTV